MVTLQHPGSHISGGNQDISVLGKEHGKIHGIPGMNTKHIVYKEEIWTPILYQHKMII